MRGTRGMGEMLYLWDCRQALRAMCPNIPGNVAKHSGECPQTYRAESHLEACQTSAMELFHENSQQL